MSTPASGATTAMVTVKVNHNGRMCRFKLPLRDMNINTLEDKLRFFLDIDRSTECVFERYSDSASAFVLLDRTNIPVYKQLYRAAKAKQRLKIRATTRSEDQRSVEPEPQKADEKEVIRPVVQVPKPTMAEDVPEPASAVPSEMTEISKPQHTPADNMDAKSTTVHPYGLPSLARMPHYPGQPPYQPEQAPTPPARPPKEIVMQEKTGTALPDAPESKANRPQFAVCCNHCEANIPEAHYHCDTCDNGDFDLCQKCVDEGVSCTHWLIKRFVRDGEIINSHTERISPKPVAKAKVALQEPVAEQPKQVEVPATSTATAANNTTAPPAPRLTPTKSRTLFCERCHAQKSMCSCSTRSLIQSASRVIPVLQGSHPHEALRTCNSCVNSYPEHKFVHCTTCDDYDLCKSCFVKDEHGHHPRHAFEVVAKGDAIGPLIKARLPAGRNKPHDAICDGCEKDITGVRHKCLDCPDWDYCSECVVNASFVHAKHRFVPIYDGISPSANRTVHVGICCDGPLCSGQRSNRAIIGVRYKCAVCHDTDFCGNCEASPANTHNKTHPLIKFRTPVRHVTVTTTGDKRDGEVLPTMGDRLLHNTSSRATSTTPSAANNSSTAIQTLVDVKPAEPTVVCKPVESKKTLTPDSRPRAPAPVTVPEPEKLEAVYVRDLITDGTVMPPGTVFNQTWILKNVGKSSWPTGCSIKFVAGDYMGHIDPSHPAGVLDLVSANESTVCYQPLEPGKEFAFNVLLRTPTREGKTVSYWRLSTPTGHPFGDRLWCDISVKAKVELPAHVQQQSVEEMTQSETKSEAKSETSNSSSESQMIFPKLDKESPVSSMHAVVKPEPVVAGNDEAEDSVEDFEELAGDDEWDENEAFNTDEEYDLLDASDEECTEINGKAAKK